VKTGLRVTAPNRGLSVGRWALLTGAVCGILAGTAVAQSQTEDRTSREQSIQRGQLKSGAAYRDLQQAQYESKLAEQDFLNAQEAQKAAQKQADESKRQLDAAKKALDAAKSKEAEARKRYDDALGAVERAFQTPPAKK
jgi:septal ring factor EnvC (AmiA/AmiB activator)